MFHLERVVMFSKYFWNNLKGFLDIREQCGTKLQQFYIWYNYIQSYIIIYLCNHHIFIWLHIIALAYMRVYIYIYIYTYIHTCILECSWAVSDRCNIQPIFFGFHTHKSTQSLRPNSQNLSSAVSHLRLITSMCFWRGQETGNTKKTDGWSTHFNVYYDKIWQSIYD